MEKIKQIFRKIFSGVLGIFLMMGLLPVSSAMAATNLRTFDHIDIKADAEYVYLYKGEMRTISVAFDKNDFINGNVKVWELNADGTKPASPISASNVTSRLESGKIEFHITRSSNFNKYVGGGTSGDYQYYLVEYVFSDPETGMNFQYSKAFSFYSKDDDGNICVCGGYCGSGENDSRRGLDIRISGKSLVDYFNPSLTITKQLTEGSADGIFRFTVTGPNYSEVATIETTGGIGSVMLGGFAVGATYMVSETGTDGYMLKEVLGTNGVVNGRDFVFTATNDNDVYTTFVNSETIAMSVEKRWGEGVPVAESVTVGLVKNGSQTNDTIILTAQEGWKGNFGGLDKYDENGQLINYAVVETAIDGQGLTNGALVVYDGEKIVGRYESTAEGGLVINNWVPATDIDNNPEVVPLKLKKVGKDNETVMLGGARFVLTKDNDLVGEYITSSNSVTLLGDLAEGKYTLREMGAPVDYELSTEPIDIEIAMIKKLVATDPVNLVNTYHNSFVVDVMGAGEFYYEAGVNTVVVKNSLQTVQVNVEKKWMGDVANLPRYVEVQLYGNGQKVGEAVRLSADTNWAHTWNDLRKSVDGEDISYTVRETHIFGASAEGFIVYGVEQTESGEQTEVVGQWGADVVLQNGQDWVIFNTWSSASHIFVGTPKFYIQKIDQDGEKLELAGVRFRVTGDNGYEEIFETDVEGKITIDNLPADVNVWDDGYTYIIEEIRPGFGYKIAEGLAQIRISANRGKLMGVDGLMNIFAKEFTLEASGSGDYRWDGVDTFVVMNKNVESVQTGGCEDGCGGVSMGAPDTGKLTKSLQMEVSEDNLLAINTVIAAAIITMISALVGVALSEKRKKS